MKGCISILLVIFPVFRALNSTYNGSCPLLRNPVHKVPGLLSSEHVCNYAGYNMGSPYFYWLILNKDLLQLMNIPLIIHIGSGNESSLAHAFRPGGPFQLKRQRNNIEMEVVESLLDIGHVMYLEQPGIFSFSKEKLIGEYTSSTFLNELRRFLDSFVTYNQFFEGVKIYVVAEGHMAKVGAMLALAQKAAVPPAKGWHTISGLIVNNGIYDLSKHQKDFGELSAELGIIPEYLMDRLIEETSITAHQVANDPYEAFNRWNFLSTTVAKASGLVNFLNDVSDTGDECGDKLVEEYLSQREVQRMLHIRKPVKWRREPKPGSFSRALPALINVSTSEFNSFLDRPEHIYTLFNIGAYSPLSSVGAFKHWMKGLTSDAIEELVNSPRLFISDPSTTIYAKENNKAAYAIYPDEGRNLGSYSLGTYLSVMDQFIIKHSLHGAVEDDTPIQTILKDCSGNGWFDKREENCVCDKNYYGADCSVRPRVAKASEDFLLGAMEWRHFFVESEGCVKYLVTQDDNRMCPRKANLVIAVNLGSLKLPDEIDNDILTTTNEIILNCKKQQKRFILGIKNTSPYCEYHITLEQISLQQNLTNVLKQIIVWTLAGFICLVLGVGIACYILYRADSKKFNELKI